MLSSKESKSKESTVKIKKSIHPLKSTAQNDWESGFEGNWFWSRSFDRIAQK